MIRKVVVLKYFREQVSGENLHWIIQGKTSLRCLCECLLAQTVSPRYRDIRGLFSQLGWHRGYCIRSYMEGCFFYTIVDESVERRVAPRLFAPSYRHLKPTYRGVV